MVGFIPTTFSERSQEDITLLSAKMSTSFFLESFIHAKEKLNIVQWVELLTKQFDSSMTACRWFLDKMAADANWPVTIFLKCQVATIRQMFMRLCIHVIQKLRYEVKSTHPHVNVVDRLFYILLLFLGLKRQSLTRYLGSARTPPSAHQMRCAPRSAGHRPLLALFEHFCRFLIQDRPGPISSTSRNSTVSYTTSQSSARKRPGS